MTTAAPHRRPTRSRSRRRAAGDDGRPLGTAGGALVVYAAGLAIAALLTAPGLHKTAFNLEPGLERDLALSVAGPLDTISGALFLDRPRALVKLAIGRSEDDDIDTAVAIPDPSGPEPVATAPLPSVPQPAATPTAPSQPQQSSRKAFTPERKLRLWIAGDSLVITPGYSIVRAASASPVIGAVGGVDGRVGTGLTRPDVFNWFKRVREQVAQLRPDVVVLHFGGNDANDYMTGVPKGVSVGSFGSASWRREYGRRVGGVMDTVSRAGAHVVWLGLPITRDPEQSRRFDLINAIVLAEAKRRPRTASYVDTYTSFAGDDGGFAEYLEDRRGRTVKARAGDGVHFERAGGDMIARLVMRRLNELYDLTSWRKRS